MAAKEQNLIVRNITPTNGAFTALVVPFNCNYLTIINQTNQDQLFRTDDTNALSEMTIPTGIAQDLSSPAVNRPPGVQASKALSQMRFRTGDIVGYFKSGLASTGNVVGIFSL